MTSIADKIGNDLTEDELRATAAAGCAYALLTIAAGVEVSKADAIRGALYYGFIAGVAFAKGDFDEALDEAKADWRWW